MKLVFYKVMHFTLIIQTMSTEQIHLYIYYNLMITQSDGCDNYEPAGYISDVCIITNPRDVREILTHSETVVNGYGELTNWNKSYIQRFVETDVVEFRPIVGNWNFHSVYWIKCEVVRDISESISVFVGK